MTSPQGVKHILVVDDYADTLDMLALYLQTMGYRVSTAADGLSAVAQAGRLLPDLIVLDLELPGLSGLEAAKRLRENPATREIPLIAATGYSQARQLDLARQSGFDAVVVKPCDPDMLIQQVERLLPAGGEQLQPSRPAVEQPRNNG